jgi:hypothetical protein
MPDTPDDAICLYLTGGYNPENSLNSGVIRRPTVMCRVRDMSYESATGRIADIVTSLTNVFNTTVNGTFYLEILLLGDINSLGKDNRNRWDFTVNFKVRCREV